MPTYISRPVMLLLYVMASAILLAVACNGKTPAPTQTDSRTRLPPPPLPASVSVQPVKPELPVDTIVAGAEALQLKAVPVDENGNPLGHLWTVVWESRSPEVAITEVDPDATAVARISGVKPGRATITATIRGKSGETTITVAPASVSIKPEVDTIIAGAEPRQLQVVLRDAKGNPLADGAVTWKSNDPGAANVDEHGLVRGIKPGQAIITATSWGMDGEAIIYVESSEGPKPHTVAVEPDSANVAEGKTVRLKAVLKDATGKELTGGSVSWKSADEQVATVSNDGIVTGVSPGKATITVLAEDKQGSTRITVVPVCTEIVTLSDDQPRTPHTGLGAEFSSTIPQPQTAPPYLSS